MFSKDQWWGNMDASHGKNPSHTQLFTLFNFLKLEKVMMEW